MNKTEFYDEVYQNVLVEVGEDIPKTKVFAILDTMFSTMKKILAEDKEVSIRGFGVFEVATSKSRKARNPQTGEPVVVPQRNRLRFRISKNLYEMINPQQ